MTKDVDNNIDNTITGVELILPTPDPEIPPPLQTQSDISLGFMVALFGMHDG
jgi:hypothetical protein